MNKNASWLRNIAQVNAKVTRAEGYGTEEKAKVPNVWIHVSRSHVSIFNETS